MNFLKLAKSSNSQFYIGESEKCEKFFQLIFSKSKLNSQFFYISLFQRTGFGIVLNHFLKIRQSPSLALASKTESLPTGGKIINQQNCEKIKKI